jgi:Lipoxygenase/Cytochrome P450
MKNIKDVWQEAARFPAFDRFGDLICLKTLTLPSGQLISRGLVCSINVKDIQLKEFGASFDPSRWEKLRTRGEYGRRFFALGHGPRQCVGRYVSDIILKVSLIELLSSYAIGINGSNITRLSFTRCSSSITLAKGSDHPSQISAVSVSFLDDRKVQNQAFQIRCYDEAGHITVLGVKSGTGIGPVTSMVSMDSAKIVAVCPIVQQPQGIHFGSIKVGESVFSTYGPIFPSQQAFFYSQSGISSNKLVRLEEIKLKKKVLTWKPWIKNYPPVSSFNSSEPKTRYLGSFSHSSNLALESLHFINVDSDTSLSFDDFKSFLNPDQLKYVRCLNDGNDWQSDVCFADSFTVGNNPDQFQVYHGMLEAQVLAFLQAQLDQDDSLEDAQNDGRIIVLDYSILGILKPTDPKRFVPGTFSLFYNSLERKRLIPISIKVVNGCVNEWICPNHLNSAVWAYAKMCSMASHNTYWAASHLGMIHIVMEVFVNSMLRQLSTAHPLYSILFPHVQEILVTNDIARKILLPLVADLFGGKEPMEKLFTDIFVQKSVRKSLYFPSSKPVSNLDSFPYWNDGTLIWDSIRKFVQAAIHHSYSSDLDVENDSELRAWISEVESKLFKFDFRVVTVNDLVDFITSLVFTSSAGHSAGNFTNFSEGAFIPFSPSALNSISANVETMSENNLIEMLPSKGRSKKFTKWLEILSFSKIETSLGDLENVADWLHPFMKEFQQDLLVIEEEINNRNAHRRLKYEALLPSNIPKGIAI